MRAIVFCLLLATPVIAELTQRDIPRLGGLCVIEAKEPCAWVVFPQDVSTYVTDSGSAMFVDTSDTRQRYITAVYPFASGESPRTDEWLVTIGGNGPGPQPDPDPVPPGPGPEPDVPQGFAAVVAKLTSEHVPVSERANVAKVAGVYREIAELCGTEDGYFTGPAIRMATQNKLLAEVPGIGRTWKTFFEKLDALNTAWATGEYRDAAAYKSRWLEIAVGLETSPAPPIPVAGDAHPGQVVTAPAPPSTLSETQPPPSAFAGRVLPFTSQYQVRNNRVLQCDRSSGRCRWVDVGAFGRRWTDSEGKLWLLVQ